MAKGCKKFVVILGASALLVSVSVAPRAWAYVPTYGPGTVTATAVSTSEIDLTWDSVYADPAVSGYEIQRESPVGGGFGTIVVNTGSAAANYKDVGLAPSTIYNYRVAAINSEGTGPFGPGSINASAAYSQTFAVPSGPPSAPASLTAAPTSSSEIDLSWVAAQSGAAILGYKIERESPPGSGFTTIMNDTFSANTIFSDTGLFPPGTTYNYRVSGINVFGPGAPSVVVTATTLAVPPSPPIGAAAVAGPGRAAVSWSSPTFPGGAVTGYVVSSTPAGYGTTTAPNATSVMLTGLPAGVSFSFTVAALNTAGVGLPAYTNTVTPSSYIAPPAVPTSTASTTVTTTNFSPTASPSTAQNQQAATSAASYLSFNLHRGLRDGAVTELQKILIRKGFLNAEPTGYFGALTEAAVRAYQRAHLVSATGFVGPLTRAYLNAGL